MSSFSWKQKWTAITPKPFAFISILSSTYIIQHVLKSRKRRSEVFHRLLLGLSLCDLFASTSFFMGTWPIPIGTKGVYLASGNKATCDAQGFFQQFFGVAPPLYNGSLAVYTFSSSDTDGRMVIQNWRLLRNSCMLCHYYMLRLLPWLDRR